MRNINLLPLIRWKQLLFRSEGTRPRACLLKSLIPALQSPPPHKDKLLLKLYGWGKRRGGEGHMERTE